MPLHCVGERRSPTETEEEEEETCPCIWQELPDSLLLHIFSFLEAGQLLHASETCKIWNRVSNDESLWKGLLSRKYDVTAKVLPEGKLQWKSEYKRLYFHSPIILSETLTDHTDEVLHVSFSHSGKMFSTTSKDSTIKVWEVGYPTTLKYSTDFRKLLSWDFTQFSCFNDNDSMLLVSSVKTTDFMDRRGFVAIMSLLHDFRIIRVVSMDPSQLFGAWLDNSTFLGGCLKISLDRFATTVHIESFEVPDVQFSVQDDEEEEPPPTVEENSGKNLFTFCSETASLIKFLTVANIPSEVKECDCMCKNSNEMEDTEMKQEVMEVDNSIVGGDETVYKFTYSVEIDNSNNCDTRDLLEKSSESSISIDDSSQGTKHGQCCTCTNCKRNLIFVTGEFAVALHQLGFKNVSQSMVNQAMCNDSADPQQELEQDGVSGEHERDEESHMVMNFSNNDIEMRKTRKSDKPDNLIDLYGHVTGLCLSRDNRYLYLNCRPWKGTVDRSDPWATPDLSSAIEVRVIDLMTLQDTGMRYVGHKGFSSSMMCCFVFLDVSMDYVGSGSEDAKGYLWDRHYGTNLTTFDHEYGVVNAVGFNPKNQEYLVTVSDDNTIKIWRSRNLIRQQCLASTL